MCWNASYLARPALRLPACPQVDGLQGSSRNLYEGVYEGLAPEVPPHPGVNLRANCQSISHRCDIFEVAFVWELTKETILLPLGCLQGGLPYTRSTPSTSTSLRASAAPHLYRGTSLIRNTPLLGPHSRTIPRALWWS